MFFIFTSKSFAHHSIFKNQKHPFVSIFSDVFRYTFLYFQIFFGGFHNLESKPWQQCIEKHVYLLQKDTHTFISNRKVNYPQPFPISPSLLYYKCKVQSNQTSHSFIDNRLYSLTFLIFLHLSYAAVSHTVVRTCDVVYACDSWIIKLQIGTPIVTCR